jgi:hypothetical protein
MPEAGGVAGRVGRPRWFEPLTQLTDQPSLSAKEESSDGDPADQS